MGASNGSRLPPPIPANHPDSIRKYYSTLHTNELENMYYDATLTGDMKKQAAAIREEIRIRSAGVRREIDVTPSREFPAQDPPVDDKTLLELIETAGFQQADTTGHGRPKDISIVFTVGLVLGVTLCVAYFKIIGGAMC